MLPTLSILKNDLDSYRPRQFTFLFKPPIVGPVLPIKESQIDSIDVFGNSPERSATNGTINSRNEPVLAEQKYTITLVELVNHFEKSGGAILSHRSGLCCDKVQNLAGTVGATAVEKARRPALRRSDNGNIV
jgi:hypothetical protein